MTTEKNTNGNGRLNKVLLWILQGMVVLCISILGYESKQLLEQVKDLETHQMALQHQVDVLPQSLPPQWFRDRTVATEGMLNRMSMDFNTFQQSQIADHTLIKERLRINGEAIQSIQETVGAKRR